MNYFLKVIAGYFAKPVPPTAQDMVVTQLEEAKQKLLNHEHQANYHAHMVKFYRDSAKRLTGYETNGDIV